MIIYKATNKINGKCYIGQTRHSLEHRKRVHLTRARQGVETHFYQAIRKYGEDNFEWTILCVTSNKQTLNELETYYITKYDSIKNGYNMVDGGDNNIMDIESVKTKHQETMQRDDVRKKISETMKRIRKENGFSESTRKKISEKLKGNHNFGSGDTRSVACHCMTEQGEVHQFHSYLDAGKWWFATYKPFPYSACVYQRKIKQSIEKGYATYGREHMVVSYPKWYKGVITDEVTNKT